jgi:hypothetical protein
MEAWQRVLTQHYARYGDGGAAVEAAYKHGLKSGDSPRADWVGLKNEEWLMDEVVRVRAAVSGTASMHEGHLAREYESACADCPLDEDVSEWIASGKYVAPKTSVTEFALDATSQPRPAVVSVIPADSIFDGSEDILDDREVLVSVKAASRAARAAGDYAAEIRALDVYQKIRERSDAAKKRVKPDDVPQMSGAELRAFVLRMAPIIRGSGDE